MDKKWTKKKAAILTVVLFAAAAVIGAVILFALNGRSNGQGLDNGKITVTFHYSRKDLDYTKWTLWVWADGGDGKDYAFSERDGEAEAVVTVSNSTLQLGYIVRTQQWDKDVSDDRFVDLSEVAGGSIDILLTEGEPDVKITLNKDVIKVSTKAVKARYDGENQVAVTFSVPVSDASKAVIRSTAGEEVLFSSIDGSEDSYTYVLSESLESTKTYCLKYGNASYTIEMPNVFSKEEFEAQYTYTGDDLGAVWSPEATVFKVWAPTADTVTVRLYESGLAGTDDLIDEIEMEKGDFGVWATEVEGNLNGTYYTYKLNVNREEVEACDPYARAAGVNGKRAMVVDLDATDPDGWENDANPNAGLDITDTIVYEVDVRDFSIDESSGVSPANRGKYMAFTETGTTNANGDATGIDYLASLGVTHIQIMPIQDFGYMDERDPAYNWGYGTENYNVPEGSYSTDPYNGAVRITETKQMIQAIHDNGMSVILDVVYNHVYDANEFCFNKIVPNYFTRIDSRGVYSNGSLCGNDTASERSMVRKYIVDSILYWVTEYHVDGFRFDLAGILDVDTINEVVAKAREIRPDLVIYGEGWNMSTVVTKFGTKLATQTSSTQTEGFGYFDDRIRARLKGKSNDNTTGYITGAGNADEIMQSVSANAGWTTNPQQIVNYVSCHDDATLWDKVRTTAVGTHEEQVRQNILASSVILTSQGISFLHAGDEMLRSKIDEEGKIVFDSYESSDAVNSIKWDALADGEIRQVQKYYQGLIAFRREHKALRLNTAEEIAARMSFLEELSENVVAFTVVGTDLEGETASKILVIYNPNRDAVELPLPEGGWSICVNGETAGTGDLGVVSGTLVVEPICVTILVQ